MDAVVAQALPNAMFEGELENGHKLIAYAADRMRRYIDALAHETENLMLHGGVEVDSAVQTRAGLKVLGIEQMAPIVGRGILLNVAGPNRLPPEHAITPEELERVAAGAGVEVREG